MNRRSSSVVRIESFCKSLLFFNITSALSSGKMSGHSHNRCDGDDKHDDTPEMGIEYSLFKKIDSDNLECLNEKIQHSGKDVFKSWENRLNTDKVSLVGYGFS